MFVTVKWRSDDMIRLEGSAVVHVGEGLLVLEHGAPRPVALLGLFLLHLVGGGRRSH